jgi:peptidoglycan hydrolase-like protein with peptidoglycan-binding domain
MGWSGKISATDEELIKTAQHLLRVLGYDVSVSGVQDARTIQAITTFQRATNITRTGRINGAVLLRLAETAAKRQK